VETWHYAQGSSISRTVTINDENGDPVQGYSGGEALAGAVWAGDDQAPLFTFIPTWNTPVAATVNVVVSGTHTAALTPANYRLRFTVNGGDAFESVLEITWAPGTATPRPTYITIRDLRAEADWIDELQNTEQHQAGFADQCADARDWLDENILRNYRAGFVSLLGYHGLALDAWFTGGNRRSQLTNYQLRNWLAQNLLMTTPRIKKVCTLFALAQICKQKISQGGKWIALAAMYRHQCNQLLVSTTAELDLNGDGIPDLPINFSAVNTLFT
jgi:hypothetical protein